MRKAGVILALLSIPSVFGVDWTNGNWAYACDFPNSDLPSVRVKSYECGGACLNNPQCTHYTWNTYNGGTCWLKYGPVTKANAFDTGDRSMVCGVTRPSKK